jgi:cation diffusion facilitator family transporter
MDERNASANRVTWIGFICNLVLTGFKFTAGVVGRSGAMVADAVHSASDIATDIVVLVGLKMASKPVDETHRYGHGKLETLASTIIGASLLLVGAGFMRSGIIRLLSAARGGQLDSPGLIALVAAAVSILVKEGLYRFTARAGRSLRSSSLVANAWHHRSDAMSSVAALLGIGGAIILGQRGRILDPVAAVLISAFLIRAALGILAGCLGELIESSLGEDVEADIIRIAGAVTGADDPHDLRTRRIGKDIAVDLHVRVNGGMRVREAHGVATEIEDRIRERFGASSFISVHIEPALDSET